MWERHFGRVKPNWPVRLGFVRRFASAKVSLAAGDLAEAWIRLQPLLLHAESLPSEIGTRLRLMAGEALARLQNRPEARHWLLIVDAAAPLNQPTAELQRLRVHLMLGDLAEVTNDLRTATACSKAMNSITYCFFMRRVERGTKRAI